MLEKLELIFDTITKKLNSLFSAEKKQTEEIAELNKKIDALTRNVEALSKKLDSLESETKEGFSDVCRTVDGKMPKKYELQDDGRPKSKKLKTEIINCRVCPSCGQTVSKMPCPHCGYGN